MATQSTRFLAHRPAVAGAISVWNHGWFVLRAMRRSLGRAIDRLALPERADVLDFGCADSPYRFLLPGDARYVGADLPGNPAAAVSIGPGSRVAVPDASADLVLSTQVLEHVDDPAAYLRECARVLRPGGHLVLTTHGFWVYHRDPVDYWRWTADGLVRQVEHGGLSVVATEGIGGLTAIAVQLFQDATRHHLPRPLCNAYTFGMQRLAAVLDRLHGSASRRNNAMVYLVTAQKRA
jgi:SAM-dependent methyltransferase